MTNIILIIRVLLIMTVLCINDGRTKWAGPAIQHPSFITTLERDLQNDSIQTLLWALELDYESTHACMKKSINESLEKANPFYFSSFCAAKYILILNLETRTENCNLVGRTNKELEAEENMMFPSERTWKSVAATDFHLNHAVRTLYFKSNYDRGGNETHFDIALSPFSGLFTVKFTVL